MIGAAVRRAAIFAALSEHSGSAVARRVQDPAYVDGFYALSVVADQQGTDSTALALAAAEGDAASAMLARVLIAERGYRSAVPVDGNMEFDSSANSICALLDAAIASDDEPVVRWLASPAVGLDVAQIRAAQIACSGAPLSDGLAQLLNSFRGKGIRELAMRAARALRAVAGAARRDGATLAAIVRAAVVAAGTLSPDRPVDEAGSLALASEAADAVWSACADAPDVDVRVRLLVDAVRRKDARSVAWPMSAPTFMAESAGSGGVRAADDAGSGADATAGGAGDETWQWPPAEPARAVVAPPMTFSASRLNAFVTCGRQWFFEYLCDAVDDRGSVYATYGKVVHEALEALHREVREPAMAQPHVVLDRFLRELDTAFGKARMEFASQFEYEVSRLQARRMAPHYVDWLVGHAAAAPMEIVEVESVNRLHAGGHDFVGYIDRIDRPVGGGAVTIFDYKTGRVSDDPRSYLDAVRSGDEAQLALYYFMRRARGDDVARMALISVRDARDGVRVLALDIVEEGAMRPPARTGAATCPRAVLDASLAALVRRCDLLTREGLAHFDVGADPPCRFCAYAPACRERPPEPERIFAR